MTLPVKSISPEKVVEILSGFLSPRRRQRIEEILSRRTRYITMVLFDMHHAHNMSAAVRSCEAFGLQDCHVIEIENTFKPAEGVAIGSHQWINIIRHSSVKDCINHLRKQGYAIFAADPPDKAEKTAFGKSYDIFSLDISSSPVAIVFGKELDGLTDEIRGLCDGVVYIPLQGFTESLNVSVTAAICMYQLRRKLEMVAQERWGLTPEEKKELRAKWYLASVKHGEKILKEMMEREKIKAAL